MPESSIDVPRLSLTLRNNAKPHSIRRCAHYVRLALEAGGVNTSGHPAHAKDWGAVLLRNGYQKLSVSSLESYSAQPGDVAIIQPCVGGSISGHIQVWDGRRWISNFIQQDFWPGSGYRKSKPAFAIYRH
jgi:hypothetical protein